MAPSTRQEPPAWAVALTATVDVLVLEVRRLRADQARRRSVGQQDDREAVLGAVVAELVGDAAFSAAG